MDWKIEYEKKLVDLNQAAKIITPGDTIITGAISGFPLELVNAVTEREDLDDLNFISGLLMTVPDFLTNDNEKNFIYTPIFMGPVERFLFETGKISPLSVNFSQCAQLIRNYQIDASILEVSPPDEEGFMCIGPGSSLIGSRIFSDSKKVIVQVNPNAPNLNGSDMHIHISHTDYICEVQRPLFETPSFNPDEDEKKIASIILDFINDGSTLQLGIGRLANAIGAQLTTKNDIGIHSELLTPSMIELHKKGVITGKKKNFHKNKIVAAFSVGVAEDYDFIHNNDAVEFHPASYVNDHYIIGKNDNLISINNAMAVDLTGQTASESIGPVQFSATGGQLDFVRGAYLSKGGKSFIALKSTAKTSSGIISKISSGFTPGTVVTTPRSDVEYIVTEYGVAHLRGKSIHDRVKEMIKIAHPDFREQLMDEAIESGLIHKKLIKAKPVKLKASAS